MGRRLQQDMARVVTHVPEMLSKALRQERFERGQHTLGAQYAGEMQRLQEAFGCMAHA